MLVFLLLENQLGVVRTKYGFGPFILILKFNIGFRVMSDYINTLNLIFGVRDNKEKIEDICHSLLF